jgi:hypothetical protein
MQDAGMCRSIHPLHNFQPPADAAEIQAAALQYVRKVSGMTRPSAANEAAFQAAVARIADVTGELLAGLVSTSPPHDRDVERQKARARWERRIAAAGRPTLE